MFGREELHTESAHCRQHELPLALLVWFEFRFRFHLEISNMACRWPPDSFWQWLPTASVEALKVAKDAIESEIAYKEAQEKEAFLQFWKDHPVPCNRCCRYYHGDQRCPFPCAHTSTDPDQWMHHSANEWHRCAAHWFL